MSITVCERIPDTTFQVVSGLGVQELSIARYFRGRRVVLFGLPGAFTPTCHHDHLPDIIRAVPEFRNQGFDCVAVTTTNDAHVLAHWSRASKASGSVDFLADANGTIAAMLGMSFDASNRGMGQSRTKRFALAADDGIITHVQAEDNPFKLKIASASEFLKHVSRVPAEVD